MSPRKTTVTSKIKKTMVTTTSLRSPSVARPSELQDSEFWASPDKLEKQKETFIHVNRRMIVDRMNAFKLSNNKIISTFNSSSRATQGEDLLKLKARASHCETGPAMPSRASHCETGPAMPARLERLNNFQLSQGNEGSDNRKSSSSSSSSSRTRERRICPLLRTTATRTTTRTPSVATGSQTSPPDYQSKASATAAPRSEK